jgi:hypothetical protein
MFWAETLRISATDKHNVMPSLCKVGVVMGQSAKKTFAPEERLQDKLRTSSGSKTESNAGTNRYWASGFVCRPSGAWHKSFNLPLNLLAGIFATWSGLAHQELCE